MQGIHNKFKPSSSFLLAEVCGINLHLIIVMKFMRAAMHFRLDALKVISIFISYTKFYPEDLSVKEDVCTSHEDDKASCNSACC